jgi:hypothetical protein
LRADGTSANPSPDPPALRHAAIVAGDEDDTTEAIERSYVDDLNPDSKRVITAFVELSLASAVAEERFQFERHGYFVADIRDHASAHPVFNRAVTLRDPWDKRAAHPQAHIVHPSKSAARV